MKLNLFAMLLCVSGVAFAQDGTVTNVAEKGTPMPGDYPNTFSSGSSEVYKFDNKARQYNDWAISIGGGTSIMTHSDLTSLNSNEKNFGWDAYISIDKQISNNFALMLQYQMGKSTQTAKLNDLALAVFPYLTVDPQPLAKSTTEYKQVSLLGDVNISNLMRRIDNHSTYRWALHAYLGMGLQGYDTHLEDGLIYPVDVHMPLDQLSFFFQGGTGLKFNASKHFDVELRAMYQLSGDDEFDGGGWTEREAYNRIFPNSSDNLFLLTLGLSYKIGKHPFHLQWIDPITDLYAKSSVELPDSELVVCKSGDYDNDGVCDDWDRQLDTPLGARVDGAGVAIDLDLDGVIDLYDKCVTIPGPVENAGCPYETQAKSNVDVINEASKYLEGIEFALNSDVIRPTSFDKLDNAAKVLKTLDSSVQYLVVGATDTRGSEEYNQKLSEKRATAVMKYLVDRGVSPNAISAVGRGKRDLRYPECNPATACPEWKNEANRRVYFELK